jgi:hypothetical protein
VAVGGHQLDGKRARKIESNLRRVFERSPTAPFQRAQVRALRVLGPLNSDR